MKIVKLFFRYTLLAGLFGALSIVSAAVHGTLHSGDEIVLKPLNAHALSITHARGQFASHSSFNFTMINKNDILYEDKNQMDDVYLVFHDDVEANDRIKIHVNRGYFNYKIAPLQTLPSIVKNVLDPEVFAPKKRPQAKQKKVHTKRVKKRPIIAPKPTVVKPAPVIVASPVEKIQEDMVAPVTSVPALETSVSYKSPIGDSFFEKFTKIFEELVETLASSSSVKNQEDGSKVKAAHVVPKVATAEPKGIETTFDDTNLKRIARENEREFRQTTQQGIIDTLDDSALQAQAQLAQERTFSTPKEIVTNTYIPVSTEEKFTGTHRYEPVPETSAIVAQKESVPTFASHAPAPSEAIAEPMRYEKESVPTFSNTPPPVISPIAEVVQTPQKVVLKEAIEVQVPVQSRVTNQVVTAPSPSENTPYYPDTGYKEGYESLEQNPKPVVVAQVPVVAQKRAVVEDTSLPTQTQVREEVEDKRLVITKIIDRPEEQVAPADPFAGRVLGRMDDRVLGNGYDGATTTGKLGMRVTKNAKPVSAWIEVFKNGTKQRVKTFYTSKGRSAKTIKLPAGTYMVRATYRSRDSKQQKTIKNIHLKEGGNVNRSIAFHDGKLRVIAKRGDKPLYVKVIAYKSGTRNKVSYDFSSRNSGVATLSLGSGTYDIEVIDHKNNRSFDSVHISGGAIETINADF